MSAMRISGLALVLFVSLVLNPLAALADDAVSVMSFNIRYGTAKDGDNAWENRKELVAKTIQNRKPDLLGLQEAIDFQVEFLAEKLPEYTLYAVPRVPGKGGETCAIFFRSELFEKSDQGTFWLSKTPDEVGSISWDSSLPRIASWVRLREKASGQELLFMNTHFDHKGPIAREQSAKLVRVMLMNIADGAPAVLTGDFNCGEDSAPHQMFSTGEKGLRDTYREANEKKELPNEITFTGFGLKPGNARIDWVLCTEEWTILEAGIDRYRGENNRHPSDHEPVYAVLEVGGGE